MRRVEILLWFVCVSPVWSQGVITTVAGTDLIFNGDGKAAVDAPLGGITGAAVDSQGSVFLADSENHLVAKLTRDGILTVVAGNGIPGSFGDGGPAARASLSTPVGLAFDSKGDLYISEFFGRRVRRVSRDGIITTVAGNGSPISSGDGGAATVAGLGELVTGIAFDSKDNLYVAVSGSQQVRKVTPQGTISTIAGVGRSGLSGDGGPATMAELSGPFGVAVDSADNLYISEPPNLRVRRVGPDGIISTVVGGGFFPADNVPATGSLVVPFGLAVDRRNNLYIADGFLHQTRKVSSEGIITTVAGILLQSGFLGDGGPATTAMLNQPFGVAADANGNVYICDRGNTRLRRVDAEGKIATVAGNGQLGPARENVPATQAPLRTPVGIAVDAGGSRYITERTGHRIRRVSPDGVIHRFAGTSVPGSLGDSGLAVNGRLNTPFGISVGPTGSVYFADQLNLRVRRVTPAGILETVAGNGIPGFAGDGGPATNASLSVAEGLALDAAENLYIADSFESRVRRVNREGVISTFAGNGRKGFGGDGGQATAAMLNTPTAVTLDAAGSIYISDTANRRVRKVTRDGIISTVAGNGQPGFGGDGGRAIEARLDPAGLAFDTGGNLYIADQGNHRVRRVSPDGIITTVAGSGQVGFGGDGGPPTNAALNLPTGLAFDRAGNLYISDQGNTRIRMILGATPSFEVSTNTVSFVGRATGAPTFAEKVRVSSNLAGLPYTASVNTVSGGAWLSASPANGTAPTEVQIVADPSRLGPGTYSGSVTLTAPNARPAVAVLNVTFRVDQPEAPRLGRLAALAFAFVERSPAATQTLPVANDGGGLLEFTASALTGSGGNWLTVSATGGAVSPAAPFSLALTANPAGLAPGTYSGAVSINSGATGQKVDVPVSMTISAIQQTILLAQSGLTFAAVAGGGRVPPQNFAVLNAGNGRMDWSAQASTLSGAAGWLSARPTSGSSDALSPAPTVEVVTDHSALGPGVYHGQIAVSAANADNSPQIVAVVLNVLERGSNPGPVLQPVGLVFAGASGEAAPSSQPFLVYNLTERPISFNSSRLTVDGKNWFLHLPGNATVDPGDPLRIIVQPDTSVLTPGVFRGVLTLGFDDGSVRTVSLLLVVNSAAPAARASRHADGGCVPKTLLPVFTTLGTNFSVPGSWPSPIEVRVVNDCGSPMTAGSVVATFSNGDPPVSLIPLRDGRWSGTWLARNTQVSQVTISVAAESSTPRILGTASIAGGVRSNPDPPVVAPGAIVSAASLIPHAALAPGGIVTIFGSRLSEGEREASSLPLETQLANTVVTIGGRPVPLLYASAGQVNAVIPYGIAVNTRHQVLIRRGSSITVPEAVTVAEAQPAIFTTSRTGKGQGVILNRQFQLLEPGNPVTAGDVIIVLCSGLGAVDPPQEAGAAARSEPLSQTVRPAQLTIGGRQADVLFSGLAPGFAGLYQVNAVVPSGVSPGADVPVVLSVAGQTSPPVTIAVR